MDEKKNVNYTMPPRAPRPTQRTARPASQTKPQSVNAVKAQLDAARTRTTDSANAPKREVPQMSAVQEGKLPAKKAAAATKELQAKLAKTHVEKPAAAAVKKPSEMKAGSYAVPESMKQSAKPVASPARPQTAGGSQKPASVQPPQKQGYRPVRPEPERITSPEMQRRRETVGAEMYEARKKRRKKAGPMIHVLRGLAFVLTFVIILASTVFISLKMICSDISPAAKELLVTTLLETGQMKDVASWFLSPEEIQQIVDGNTMGSFENDIDSSLISIDKTPEAGENGEEQKDIEVVEISGRTFFGTMLIIKDPSRIELASIYPWKEEGVPLDQLVHDAGAVAGINGGLYNSSNNSGGKPYGVVVCKGEIQLNEPQQYPGLVLIGFTEDDILEIIPIGDYSKKDVENLVREKKIRDAVTFQEEASDKNNHFVQLVINGEARDMNGMGSGLNPRTAIGQRADGSVLMLVTDGRGKAGHLGASASDLINIMVEYGAVNAANLDGGSSSCMYYNDEYLMTSVTFYYSNSSWKLPLGFVVK